MSHIRDIRKTGAIDGFSASLWAEGVVSLDGQRATSAVIGLKYVQICDIDEVL
jgi:hypothetical protein